NGSLTTVTDWSSEERIVYESRMRVTKAKTPRPGCVQFGVRPRAEFLYCEENGGVNQNRRYRAGDLLGKARLCTVLGVSAVVRGISLALAIPRDPSGMPSRRSRAVFAPQLGSPPAH